MEVITTIKLGSPKTPRWNVRKRTLMWLSGLALVTSASGMLLATSADDEVPRGRALALPSGWRVERVAQHSRTQSLEVHWDIENVSGGPVRIEQLRVLVTQGVDGVIKLKRIELIPGRGPTMAPLTTFGLRPPVFYARKTGCVAESLVAPEGYVLGPGEYAYVSYWVEYLKPGVFRLQDVEIVYTAGSRRYAQTAEVVFDGRVVENDRPMDLLPEERRCAKDAMVLPGHH